MNFVNLVSMAHKQHSLHQCNVAVMFVNSSMFESRTWFPLGSFHPLQALRIISPSNPLLTLVEDNPFSAQVLPFINSQISA